MRSNRFGAMDESSNRCGWRQTDVRSRGGEGCDTTWLEEYDATESGRQAAGKRSTRRPTRQEPQPDGAGRRGRDQHRTGRLRVAAAWSGMVGPGHLSPRHQFEKSMPRALARRRWSTTRTRPDEEGQGEVVNHAASQEEEREHGEEGDPEVRMVRGKRLVHALVDELGEAHALQETHVLPDPVEHDDGVVDGIAADGEKGGHHGEIDLMFRIENTPTVRNTSWKRATDPPSPKLTRLNRQAT